jgi:hypothetical protein
MFQPCVLRGPQLAKSLISFTREGVYAAPPYPLASAPARERSAALSESKKT